MKRPIRLITILLPLPLILGVYGFVILADEPFLDSVFNCVVMYVMNYGDTPPNFLVEIARWTAPLVMASFVVLAINSLERWAVSRWRYLWGGSVAVYGPEMEKETVLTQLGKRGISGQESFVKAERYILLNSESENFAFYQAHEKQLRGHQVYLKCESLPAQSISEPNLKLLCPEEIAARLFWRQRDVYFLWKNSSGTLKIVLLGFGKLGEELLCRGLQNNLFGPEQRLEYHVFGDCAAFLATHTSLQEISDPVIRHQEPWYDSLELLEQAQLLLVLQQEEQPALLQALLSTTLHREIDVFSSEEPALALLAQRERLRLFPWRTQTMELRFLFEDILYQRAKRINLRYAHLYQGVAETAENMETEWGKLDPFTRYSNISSADYHEIRLKLLQAQGLPSRAEELSAADMELLAELEHIRWCRYHYLNNWRFGRPEDGRAKDPIRRMHALLIPYDELSEAEKEKDRENIRVLLSIR